MANRKGKDEATGRVAVLSGLREGEQVVAAPTTDFTVGTTELTGDLIALSLVLVALSAIYEIGMLVTRGATAGKLALGMRVARIADGQKPQLSDAAIRWAVPAVARTRKPRSARRLTGKIAERLSRLARETNTVPSVGRLP